MTEQLFNREQDDWQRSLNRAVREFASTVADNTPVSSAARTMLRQIGEAITVDHGTLAELSDADPPAVLRSWHWSRHSHDEGALLPLTAAIKVERDPVVLGNGSDQFADDDVMASFARLDKNVVHSAAVIPIGDGTSPIGVLAFGASGQDHGWSEPVVEHLQLLGEIVAGTLNRRRHEEEHARADRADAGVTSAVSVHDNAAPEGRSGSIRGFDGIVGESPMLRAALNRLEEVARTESTVLLLGETGTGKELFARAVHMRSSRRVYSLVSVNCGALPATLIESELFGHQRGAFTGAVGLRQGRFELAHRGTLFLDEIGDLPAEVQVKLLRVLQEGVFERVGSSQSHSVDVRIIAATHRDLERAVADGEFRADLYYRLNVFPIRLPALRDRRDDIPALVWSIIRKRERTIHRQIKTVPPELMEQFKRHSWPGNVRELENIVERGLIQSTGDTLRLLDWSPDIRSGDPINAGTLKSVERAHIQEVLRECGWKINGFGNAADRLGLHPNTLRFRMKKLGIIRHTAGSDAIGRAS